MTDAIDRQALRNQMHHFANNAMVRYWWKPLDVSLSDAREIAQDAIRVAIEEVVNAAPSIAVTTPGDSVFTHCDCCDYSGFDDA